MLPLIRLALGCPGAASSGWVRLTCALLKEAIRPLPPIWMLTVVE